MAQSTDDASQLIRTRESSISTDSFEFVETEGDKISENLISDNFIEGIEDLSLDKKLDDENFIANFHLYAYPNQLDALTKLRKSMSKKGIKIENAIDEFLKSDAFNFVQECMKSSNVEVQKEVTWILINVSAGSSEQASSIITSEVIDYLIELIDSEDLGLVENSIWALSNIAHEEKDIHRLHVIRNLGRKIDNLFQKSFSDLNETALVTIIGFIRQILLLIGRDYALPNHAPFFKCLLENLSHSNSNILKKTLQALVTLVSNDKMNTDFIIMHKAILQIVNLLENNEDVKVKIEAAKLVGNILAGPNEHADEILAAGLLDIPLKLMENIALRNLIVRCLSNIAAGNEKQVLTLIESKLLPTLIDYFDITEDHQTHVEVSWAIANLVECAVGEFQLRRLLLTGIFPKICEKLYTEKIQDDEVRQRILKSLGDMKERCKLNHKLCQKCLDSFTPFK